MNLKKFGSLLMLSLLIIGLVACSGNGKSNEESKPAEPAPTTETASDNKEPDNKEPESNFDSGKAINVISREDGSGTRGAFTEITKVLEKVDGEEVDQTTIEAVIQNGTNGVMTTVAGDEYAIGYISLGSLNDTVKAIQVEGVHSDADEVKSGNYKLARPFNVAWKEDAVGEIGKDLLDFILSEEGQKIVEENGFVAAVEGDAYTPSDLEGQITVAGSTSVTPVMEKLVEAYTELNKNVKIDIQSTGSSAGMTAAIDGTANIGMASRDLKDEEASQLEHKAIAIDGIAVIVNNANSLENLTMDQIRQIFIGEITNWSEVVK